MSLVVNLIGQRSQDVIGRLSTDNPFADFTKAALSPQLFNLCWSGRGLNPRPPAR